MLLCPRLALPLCTTAAQQTSTTQYLRSTWGRHGGHILENETAGFQERAELSQ